MSSHRRRHQLLLSGAALLGALGAYGRSAHAQCVLSSAPSDYLCSGTVTSTQTINADNAAVTTASGFSVDTTNPPGSGGNALTITGAGAISYMDANASNLIAPNTANALAVTATGDIRGGNTGSVAIDTGGNLTGGNAILTQNYGSGDTIIAANGDVRSYGTDNTTAGINARNGRNIMPSGKDIIVTTGAGSTVSGYSGIVARNYGTGSTTVTAKGTVQATRGGIYGLTWFTGKNLTITSHKTVKGGSVGISTLNLGSGDTAITANGDVEGTSNTGILLLNTTAGSTATVTTGAGTRVKGGTRGIDVRAQGGGDITITTGAGSTVTSTGTTISDVGIFSYYGATNLTVGGTVNGGGGGAVLFDQIREFDDRLELRTSAKINGTVQAGPGEDTLAFGGTGSGSFDLSKIDDGTMTKQYQSFEDFQVESGKWTFSGVTTEAFTQSGGVLGGTGTFGGLTVNGGTLAPGNSIGTMTVNGAFSLGAASTFEVEVNAAGNNDKVVVNGTVNLTGATLRVLAANGDYKPSTDYTIIENDGTDKVKGIFGKITSSLAFLTPSVIYNGGTGNDVVLTLERNETLFPDVAKTRNERAVAGALAKFPSDNPLFLAVLNQTATGARQAFNALSGEIHATVAGTLADDSRYTREAVMGRMMQASHHGGALGSGGPRTASYDDGALRLGSDAYDGKSLVAPVEAPPIAFWTEGFGAWGNFNGDGNAATADRDLGGFISGMDASLGEAFGGSWRAGIALGASFSSVDVDVRNSSADVETFHLGGYVGGNLEGFALRGGGLWAFSEVDTSRAVLFPGFFERQKASYDADTGQIFGEVAYPTQAAGLALEPFAGLAYVGVSSDSFRERGGAQASLRGRDQNQDVGYTSLGLRVASTMMWGEMEITPHLSAAWQHAFSDLTPLSSLAYATTGIGFEVAGVPLAKDTALIDAGLDLALSETLSAGVAYSGQYGEDVSDNAVKGQFTWLF